MAACCTKQRRWLSTRVHAYIGYDVSCWTLSYLHGYGGDVRNDEFERYYFQREGSSTMIASICWSIATMVLIASDVSELSGDTFRNTLIARFIAVIHVNLMSWLLHRSISRHIATISLSKLRILTIIAYATPLIWTEALRLGGHSSYYAPSSIPLVLLAEATTCPLLYRHQVAMYIVFGVCQTIAELAFYGFSTDVGIGAWTLVFVMMQCSLIAYLREVLDRRLFGLANPLESVDRWRSASQQAAPKRLSEMLPDPVFSESFSQLPEPEARASVSMGHTSLTVNTEDSSGSSNSGINSSSSSRNSNTKHPGLPRPISDPLTSPHSINSSSSSSSHTTNGTNGTNGSQAVDSYEIWYDQTNMEMYSISLMMIALSTALFGLADYIILYQRHANDWFTEAIIVRYALMIGALLLTLLLTRCQCNHAHNRMQLWLCICTIIVGVGPLLHYGLRIPLTNNGIWSTASNHYLTVSLRYLMMISSSYRLRFSYSCLSMVVVYVTGAIGITIVSNTIPTEYIMYGIAYSITGIWLSYSDEQRQRVLHAALLNKQPSTMSAPSPSLHPSHHTAITHDYLPSLNSSSHISSGDRSTSSSIDFGLAASPRGGLVDDS